MPMAVRVVRAAALGLLALGLLGCDTGAAAPASADGVGVCKDDAAQHSGYLSAGSDGAEYFYYLATSRSATPAQDPLVVWLTGGPGCSSLLAMITENGPCRLEGRDGNGGWKTTRNSWAWNSAANVVWVDQPVGVGFSSTDGQMVQDERQVAERMFSFLQNFYAKFPEYLQVPLFVTGESYGGHFVPAVAARVLQGQGDGVGVLQGISLGNGLVDPVIQYKSKPIMAFTGGTGGSLGHGVVSKEVYENMSGSMDACTDDIMKCQEAPSPANCVIGMMTCAMTEIMPLRATPYNPYDMRQRCDVTMASMKKHVDPATALCYNYTSQTQFFNDPATKKLLGVPLGRPWQTCNQSAMLPFIMSGDYLQTYRSDVQALLAGGVRVLVYAGDTDAMVDWVGCRAWVEALPWPHQQEWLAAPNEPYLQDANGKSQGRRQSAYGLTFVQVYNAGHMVPMDQPEVALTMMTRELFTAPSMRNGPGVPLQLFGSNVVFPSAGFLLVLFASSLLVTLASTLWTRFDSRRHERDAGYILIDA